MRRPTVHASSCGARFVLISIFCPVIAGAPASKTFAQTAPLPAVVGGDQSGVLTRGAFFISLAGLQTDDPRFSLAQRSRADVDLVGYGHGRVNFLMDAELVMGSERRSFDLNQANVIFEASASYLVGPVEVAAVAHHVSRHVADRGFARV